MILDYQCVTEGAVASSRLMKARQYVTPETLTDESTSIRNSGDVYDGIRLGQTMAKFRGWPYRVADHGNL